MDKKLAAAAFIALIAAIAAYAILMQGEQSEECSAIGSQEARDGCYHDSAHRSRDKTLCSNIIDAGEREHCIGHVPG